MLRPGKGKRWLALAAIFIALGFVHHRVPHMQFEIFGDRVDIHYGVSTIALLYIALAVGLNMTIGFVGMLDLGYAAFIGIGAYTLAIFSSVSSLPPPLAVAAGVLLAAALAGIIRAALGATCLRLRGDYLAIVTLGFGEIFITLMKNDFLLPLGRPEISTGGPDGISLGLLRLSFTEETRYVAAFAAAVAVVFISRRIKFSRIGRAFEAIRDDEIAAEAMGIPVFRMKLLAYTLGGVIAGAIGAMLALENGSANTANCDFLESARVVAMVVVGGTGSIFGSALGAVFFIFVLEIFRPLAQYRLLIFGLVMVAVMIARPAGFLSVERRRAKEVAKA